jgi:hypothetical protein
MPRTEAPTTVLPNDGVPYPRQLRVVAGHPYLTVGVVALVVRVVFAVVSFKVNRYLIPDEQQYVELATTVAHGKSAESWFTFYGQHLYDTTWPYTGIVRFLYDVFWPSRLIAQLYPTVAASGAAVLTTFLARRLVSPFFAAIAGLIMALLPSQVLWSSVALREGVVWFCLVGLAVLCALALERRDPAALVAIVGGICLLLFAVTHLRNQTLVAAVWALMLAGWFGARHRIARGSVAVAIGVLLPVFFGLGPASLGYVTSNAKTISERRTYLALNADSGVTDVTVLAPVDTAPSGGGGGGGGGGGRGGPSPTTTVVGSTGVTGQTPRKHVSTPKGSGVVVPGYFGESYLAEETTSATLRHLPRGLLATLVRPFPWEHARNAGVLVARVENVIWYVLYVLAIAGAWLARRKAVFAFPVLLAGGIIAIAGVSQGNVGTAFRHRGQIGWVVALLSSVAIERLYGSWVERRLSTDGDGVPSDAVLV